jgi:signal transduction histidine kinase
VDVDAEGLMVALAALTDRVRSMSDVECRFDCSSPARLQNNETALHLYRIAQESITNAIKHGQAENIRVRLEQTDGVLTLTVVDDGRGFVDSGEGRGLGLRTMAFRAELIGATLEIGPGESRGTLVACRLPLD